MDAEVAELVDALDSGSSGQYARGSSNLPFGTIAISSFIAPFLPLNDHQISLFFVIRMVQKFVT